MAEPLRTAGYIFNDHDKGPISVSVCIVDEVTNGEIKKTN